MNARATLLVLVCLACLLLWASPVAATVTTVDGHWQWQSPLPQGESLRGASFVSVTEGWAVGDAGIILHTSDGGTSWEQQTAPEDVLLWQLSDVCFVDALRGWAVGGGGRIITTADGGATWARQRSGTFAALEAVAFVDELRGWAVGERIVLATTDGGATWVIQYVVPEGRQSRGALGDVAFVDALNGWAVGGFSGYGVQDENDPGRALILRTSDGGSTWTQQSSGLAGLRCVEALSADAAVVVGADNGVATTTDGGVTWSRRTAQAATDLYAVAFSDGQNGWAVGTSVVEIQRLEDLLGFFAMREVPVVLHTSDGGLTWSPVAVPQTEAEPLVEVCAVGTKVALFGSLGGIVISDDDGGSWTRAGETPGAAVDLTVITPVDRDAVWAAGSDRISRGVVMRSSDGGASWSTFRDSAFDDGVLTCLSALDENTAWVGGLNGRIARTVDGGATWSRQATGVGAKITAISFSDARRGWALGAGSWVLRTTDGGETWRLVDTGTGVPLHDVRATGPDSCWVAGGRSRATVAWTADGGVTWKMNSTKGTLPIERLAIIGPDEAWAIVGAGVDEYDREHTLVHTTDAGASWVESWVMQVDQWLEPVEIAASGDHVWVLGAWGVVLQSADRGAHWGATWLGVEPSGWSVWTGLGGLRGLGFADEEWGWVAGGGASILRTTVGGGILPITSSNLKRMYIGKPHKVRLTPYDNGLGLGVSQSRIGDGPWVDGTTFVIPAPADHALDGPLEVAWRSIDGAGNREQPWYDWVVIDTRKPRISVSGVRVRKGATARVPVLVRDIGSDYCSVRVRVLDRNGRVRYASRRTWFIVDARERVWLRANWPVGRYRLEVRAWDFAGNTSVVRRTLRVY